MKRFYKRTITFVLALILCFAAVPFSALADDQVYPVKPDVTWYPVEEVTKIEKGNDVCTVTALVKGETVNFHISFPAEGGFRLYTDLDGVFTPESIEKIEYSESASGDTVLTSSDGTKLELKKNNTVFSIAVSRDKKEVLKLSSSDMEFGYNIRGELEQIRLTAPLHSDEQLYGFGQRFNSVNQVGYKLQIWNFDNVYHSKDGNLETKTYSYINVPLFHSTKGYTVFLNSAYCVDADLGATDRAKYVLESYGPKFDFYYWTKTPVENLRSYTDLTGRSFLPPKWAFSYWAGATGHNWSRDDDGGIGLLQQFLNGYKKLGLGSIAAIYTESPTMFDRVAYSMCKKNGTRMLMWTSGYFGYEKIFDTLKLVDSELPVVRSSINEWDYHVVNNDTAFLDHTHPNAKEFMKRYLEQYIKWGCKGMMVDMGEKIPQDALYYNGISGAEMHNFSSYYYLKVVNEAVTELMDGEKDFVLFQRSGCAGSQSFGANFLGDNNSYMSGLKQQINAGLSLSASGFGCWGGDIGGFNTVREEETYLRWLGFSVFEPLMREHGVGTCNPWEFSEYAQQVFVKYYWLRENLVDTIYSAAAGSNAYGIPMAQTMQLAFPDEPDTHKAEYQYMFCDNLLVAPVVENNVVSRNVILPEGNWYNLWDGTRIEGGKEIVAEAPQDRIPVYLKAGALMPITVADSYKLSDSLLDGNTEKALLVTPSDSKTKFEVFDDTAENSMVYTSTKKDKDTFVITADGVSDRGAVLAYGVMASSICVDGRYLPRINSTDNLVGYYIDDGKTVIVLPNGGWKKLQISGKFVGGKGENLAEKAVITDSKNDKENTVLASLKNNENQYYWSASSVKGTYLQLELDRKYSVETMVLKWGAGYAKEYTVEASADGDNWETVYTADSSSGGIETITFSTDKVKYIRISGFKRGGNIPATLYNVSLYEKQDIPTSLMSSKLFSTLSVATVLTGGSMTVLMVSAVLVFLSICGFTAAIVLKIRKHKKSGPTE